MSEIGKVIDQLYGPAKAASEHAYSPYSGASVGAAVLDGNGNIHIGCNVENASYSLTQCAERNALAAAVGAGMAPGTARAVLIYATGFNELAPCGACRQVIQELLAEDGLVICCSSETDYRSWRPSELLPDSFILA
ncbi:MAG: cytidine deaminase [Lysobacterales bacterium]|jgi:cytidine deaminase